MTNQNTLALTSKAVVPTTVAPREVGAGAEAGGTGVGAVLVFDAAAAETTDVGAPGEDGCEEKAPVNEGMREVAAAPCKSDSSRTVPKGPVKSGAELGGGWVEERNSPEEGDVATPVFVPLRPSVASPISSSCSAKLTSFFTERFAGMGEEDKDLSFGGEGVEGGSAIGADVGWEGVEEASVGAPLPMDEPERGLGRSRSDGIPKVGEAKGVLEAVVTEENTESRDRIRGAAETSEMVLFDVLSIVFDESS